MNLYIIYTDTDLLLTKRAYTSWREIQDEYTSYKASLGPWDFEEIVNYLEEEYGGIYPSALEQVKAFLASPDEVRKVSFQ